MSLKPIPTNSKMAMVIIILVVPQALVTPQSLMEYQGFPFFQSDFSKFVGNHVFSYSFKFHSFSVARILLMV
jgi:hypothetical protein